MAIIKSLREFESIVLDIEVGDMLLGGRFKNKKVVVDEIGVDSNNQPTVNGKPLLKFRIKKLVPGENKALKESVDGVSTQDSFYETVVAIAKDDIPNDAIVKFNDLDAKKIKNFDAGTYRNNYCIEFDVDEKYLTGLLSAYDGDLQNILEYTSSDRDYQEDSEELNYIHYYLDDNSEGAKKLKKLFQEISTWFGDELELDDDIEDGCINEFMSEHGLDVLKTSLLNALSDLKISRDRAAVEARVVNASPVKFDSNYSGDFGMHVYINFDSMMSFMDKYKEKSVKLNGLEGFIELVGDEIDFTDECVHETGGYETTGMTSKFYEDVFSGMDLYWKDGKPTARFIEVLIDNDDVVTLSEHVDDIDWDQTVYGDKPLIHCAERNSAVYDWFGSDDFVNHIKNAGYTDEFIKLVDDNWTDINSDRLGI